MYISIKTALAMIKKRKGQSFVIGLIICLTSILLYTGISLINTNEPFEEMYERAKGSHNFIFASEQVHNYDKIIDWWQEQSNVENVNLVESIDVKIDTSKNNQSQLSDMQLAEYNPNANYDIIYNTDIKRPRQLKENEIYINTAFATQNNIKKNDLLKVHIGEKVLNLKVADIVVDPQYSSILSMSRCWVTKGFLNNYDLPKTGAIGIRYISYSNKNETSLINAFEEYTKDDFPVQIFTYENINFMYSFLYSIISTVLLLVSIIMLIIVTFIIKSTISNKVLDQYKSIGVMKAIGYSSKNIVTIYTFKYCFISFIGSIFGIIIGFFVQIILLSSIKDILLVPITTKTILPSFLTVLVVQLLILLFSILSARKSIKIKPVQAIKYGMPEEDFSKSRLKLKSIERLPISTLLAVKQIIAKIKHNVFIVVSLAFIIFLSFSIVSLLNTFNSNQIIEYFTSTPVADMTVTYTGDKSAKKIMSELKNIEEIDQVIYSVYSENNSIYSNKYNKQIRAKSILLMGDTDSYGFKTTKGRFPKTENEVMITTNLGKELGKNVGDYIEITTINGTNKYLISGFYQSVIDLGISYTKLYTNTDSNMQILRSYYSLKFNDNTNFNELEKQLVKIYGEDIEITHLDKTSEELKSVTEQLPKVFILLLTIFYIVCGAVITNWTLIEIKRSSKMYGILKASGLSNKNVIKMMLAKTLILTTIACVIGFIIGIIIAPIIMKLILAIVPYELTNMNITLSIISSLLTILFYFITTLLATLIPARKISKITPKILIIE
ncbi:MAG: FtsX-like permease family protein [bacterium]